jgi:hypothetical protein
MEIPEKYLIRRISSVSGKMNEMEIMLTLSQFKAVMAWQRGEGPGIQYVLPHHSAEVREFLMTGLNVEEQNSVFGEEEE